VFGLLSFLFGFCSALLAATLFFSGSRASENIIAFASLLDVDRLQLQLEKRATI